MNQALTVALSSGTPCTGASVFLMACNQHHVNAGCRWGWVDKPRGGGGRVVGNSWWLRSISDVSVPIHPIRMLARITHAATVAHASQGDLQGLGCC